MSKKLNKAAALLLEAYKRHSGNPDWYAVQLSVAAAYTKGDLKKTIALADAMYEVNPQPPAITDEHEVAAQQQLANHLSEQSASFSLGAAFASTDWRGVEHRGKGSSRGGQFVRKGEGEADAPESADLAKTGPPEPVANVPSGGVSPPKEDFSPPIEDDFNLDWLEGVADPEIVEAAKVVDDPEAERLDEQSRIDPAWREQVRQKMQTMPIASQRPLNTGMNGTDLVTFEDGSMAVWKPRSGENDDPDIFNYRHVPVGEQYKREVANHSVAEVLGIGDLVPETVLREHNGTVGSMQRFHTTATIASNFLEPTEHVSSEDKIRSALFDYVTLNSDRRSPNWMLDNKNKPVLIDNGLSFPEKISTDNIPSHTFLDGEVMRSPIPESIRVWASKHEEVAHAIDASGIGKAGRDAAIKRLMRLGDRKYKNIQQLIYDQELYNDYNKPAPEKGKE